MKVVAYQSPWVPVEWLLACGTQPRWISPCPVADGHPQSRRGVCPYAAAVADRAASKRDYDVLVLTTTCDQMRYAAGLLEEERLPLFLLNVPSTCTAAAAAYYRQELERLGRFLSGTDDAPARQRLGETMRRLAEARAQWSQTGSGAEAGGLRLGIEALNRLRSGEDILPASAQTASEPSRPDDPRPARNLAIVGGPLTQPDLEPLEVLESWGARFVLDATEGGVRTMPRPFRPEGIREDPLGELSVAYFEGIRDVFRRPNQPFYVWLGDEISARHIQGIVFLRYVWCDLWHAELLRLRRWSPVPVLDIDRTSDEDSTMNRTAGRLEAFWEQLTAS